MRSSPRTTRQHLRSLLGPGRGDRPPRPGPRSRRPTHRHPTRRGRRRPGDRRPLGCAETNDGAARPRRAPWSLWQGWPEEYPVTGLPAFEAVQAAARQSTRAAEELDLALRRAFFSASRCIGLRHEILAAARECPSVDVDHITAALDTGSCRAAVSADFAAARADGIECSGTVVLPDGTAVCNPGTRTGWIGGTLPRGTPVLLEDHPQIYDEIIAATLDA